MSRCPWKIRPFPNDTELHCLDADDGHNRHTANLLDYAYAGSKTVITWIHGDRRQFTGDWPGKCTIGPCTLPSGHHGRCAP